MAPKNLTAIFEFISKIVSFLFLLLSLSFPFLFLLSPVILSFSFETDRGGAEKTHKELFWNDCQKCWLQARTYWKSVQFSMRIVFTNACRWTQSDIWEASLGFLIRNSFFKNRRFHTAIYLKIVSPSGFNFRMDWPV